MDTILENKLPDTFVCSKCGELPIDRFTEGAVIYRIKKGQKTYLCKKCTNQYHKHYRNENKEKILKYNKQYRSERKSNISQYAKQYYSENKENMLEYQKQYYNDNKDNRQKYNKKYNYENRNKRLEYNKQWKKDNGLQLKSTRIWNGTNTEYNLDDFLNNKGVVYFIGDIHGLYVKIGITSNIFSLSHRFRSIQGCNPMPLKLLGFIQTNNARKLEKQLHQQFKTHNRIGEWHILAPEIQRYIKENCMYIELANTMIGETYLSLPSLLADDLGY